MANNGPDSPRILPKTDALRVALQRLTRTAVKLLPAAPPEMWDEATRASFSPTNAGLLWCGYLSKLGGFRGNWLSRWFELHTTATGLALRYFAFGVRGERKVRRAASACRRAYSITFRMHRHCVKCGPRGWGC